MRSNTTSNRVICPRDGWLKRVGFSIATLVVMLLVPMANMAANHDGNKVLFWFAGWNNYDPKPTGFTPGNKVKSIRYTFPNTSSASQQDLHFVQTNVDLTNNAWKDIEGYLAVSNTQNWTFNANGLCNAGSGGRYLSVMKLVAGTKITINFSNANIYFIDPSQVTNNGNNGNVVQSGTTYTMAKDGMLDLAVERYTRIDNLQIEYNNSQLILDNRDRDGNLITPDGTKDGMPFYRYRLSRRSFFEPLVTAIGCDFRDFVVEDYNFTPTVNQKHVAIGNNTDNSNFDLMFINEGWIKVTARSWQGNSISYLVESWDNEAYYTLTYEEGKGMTYRFAKDPEIANDDDQGGVLHNRVVTAVPGITVKFGIPVHKQYDFQNTYTGEGENWDQYLNDDYSVQPNTCIISNYDNYMVSYLFDDRGWWDRYPNNNHTWPWQGTYYVFEATADGVLRLGGYKGGQSGSVYIVNLDNVTDRIYLIPQGNNIGHYEDLQEINLKAGQRYALHGESDSEGGNWAPFGLEWFSFESNIKMTDKYGVSDETGYEIATSDRTFNSRETFTSDAGGSTSGLKAQIIDYKGTVTSANVTIDNDGTLKFTNVAFNNENKDKAGGAIKVRIYIPKNSNHTSWEEGDSYMDYVMTIPYGNHVWDFRQTAHQNSGDTDRFKKGDYSYTPTELVGMMGNNGTDWSRVYKVHRRSNGVWNELVSPILSARGSIIGNNAFYMDNTNGLIFLTSSESFGAEETENTHGSEYDHLHGLAEIDDDEEYYYPYTTVVGADKVWIQGDDASILFPGVKAGQYIKIYTYRHSDDRGQTFKAKNLVDLDNVAYDYNTTFKMNGFGNGSVYPAMVGDNMRGAAIFRVPENYTATNDPDKLPRLTLCDIGWAQIFRIEIMDEYEPDLLLTVYENYSDGNVPVEYDAVTSSILIRNNEAQTRNYLAISGYTGCQNANTCEYELIPDAGVSVDYEHERWESGGGVPYNQMNATFNSGNGLVKVIQREKVNSDASSVVPGNKGDKVSGQFSAPGYVIDKNIYYIAVGELNPQQYPYTWDFSTYNLYQNASTTKTGMTDSTDEEYGDWNADTNNEDGFGQQHFVTVDFEDNNQVDEVAEVNKHLFAQGAQLTTGSSNGQTLIVETEGLGVKRPYGTDKQFPYLHTVNGTMQVDYRNYQSYDLEEDGINFDGEVLKGVGEITIPDVDNGMYVFVMSDAAPSKVLINNAQATKLTKFDQAGNDIPSDVYVYQNTGNAADVVLSFAKTTGIKKIGVTNIVKSLNKLGYATESRERAIDHTYTGKFTNNDANAYGVLEYGKGDYVYQYKGYTMVNRTAEVTVVPANTGVVLYKEGGADAKFNVPLFVPACNVVPTEDDLNTLKDNWMAPNVTRTLHSSDVETKGRAMGEDYAGDDAGLECIKFVMTTKGITYNGNSHTSSDVQREIETECFYRMILAEDQSKNYLGDHKAYLLVPKGGIPYAVWDANWDGQSGFANTFFLDLNIEDLIEGDLDGINTIASDNNSGEQVYYTIDGTRINGKPTAKGVYICNGKKVMVK